VENGAAELRGVASMEMGMAGEREEGRREDRSKITVENCCNL